MKLRGARPSVLVAGRARALAAVRLPIKAIREVRMLAVDSFEIKK
jgi:hypothetical protein